MTENTISDRLRDIRGRYDELGERLSDPEVYANPELLSRYGREQAELAPAADLAQKLQTIDDDLELYSNMIDSGLTGSDLEDARADSRRLHAAWTETIETARQLLLPRDPNDERNVIVEIRAGTGGEEAALFAAELCRMYGRFAERQGWTVEILNQSDSASGGVKEAILEITGKGAYSRLKYESGGHRVQRVPVTESGGRLHTSMATVAVLPEVEDVDIEVNKNDLRVDVFRSSGHGGQSVNTTDSAVRVTYLPTGMVVTCQDGKSQIKNLEKAMNVLRARLWDLEQQKRARELSAQRKSLVGSGDRNERVRTYNFPQDRLTDERLSENFHNLPVVMDGDLTGLMDALAAVDRAERLQAVE